MKICRACLLLCVAVSALAPRAAQALDIDYTLTGLTAWNGAGFGQGTAFDPTPDRPFRLTFNLNDSPLWGYRFNSSNDQVEFAGVSPDDTPAVLSIAGASPITVGGPEGDFFLENPASSGGGAPFLPPLGGDDLSEYSGGPPFRIVFRFSGPALFHYTNGQATFETGTFDLTGRLGILIESIDLITTPLADVVLTAQSVPVPEGASWLLAASCAAGVAGAYGMRRGHLRPARGTQE